MPSRMGAGQADYTGQDIDEASVVACIDAATKLLHEAKERLAL